MKRYLIILSVLPLLFDQSFGQLKPGARQIALAHSDLSYSSNAFTIFSNPAGSALNNKREADLFYSPAPFDVKELSNAYAAYLEPTDIGNFSAGFSIYGFDLYKETQFALGYAYKLVKNFYIGGSLIYRNTSIKNYGSKGFLLFNMGAIAQVNNYLGFGFFLENITRSNISDDSNQIPTVFWVGFHLSYMENFIFSAAIQKEIGFNPSLRLGMEYSLSEFFHLRFGAFNEPNTFCGGFGVIYKFAEFDYAVTSHPDLGLTHQFGLQIRFN